jgi:uncharacterized protein YkwD
VVHRRRAHHTHTRLSTRHRAARRRQTGCLSDSGHARHRKKRASRKSDRRSRTSGTRRRSITITITPVATRAPGSATRPAAARAEGGATCSGAGLTPSREDVATVRAATLCLINRERAGAGEGALQLNPDLQTAAQEHAESMADGGYFEHDGPGGSTVLERLQDSGYIYSSAISYEIGENIAWGSMQDSTPAAIVAAWMASPGHRANILNPEFRDTGIGIAYQLPSGFSVGQAGAMYTQDFGVVD